MRIKKGGQVRIVTENAYQSYWKRLGFKPLSEPVAEPPKQVKEEPKEIEEVKEVKEVKEEVKRPVKKATRKKV